MPLALAQAERCRKLWTRSRCEQQWTRMEPHRWAFQLVMVLPAALCQRHWRTRQAAVCVAATVLAWLALTSRARDAHGLQLVRSAALQQQCCWPSDLSGSLLPVQKPWQPASAWREPRALARPPVG